MAKMQGERGLDAQKPQEQDYGFSLCKGHLKPKAKPRKREGGGRKHPNVFCA